MAFDRHVLERQRRVGYLGIGSGLDGDAATAGKILDLIVVGIRLQYGGRKTHQIVIRTGQRLGKRASVIACGQVDFRGIGGGICRFVARRILAFVVVGIGAVG